MSSTFSPQPELIPHAGEPVPDEGIDLLAIVAVFLTQWRLLLISFAIVLVLAFALIFSLKSLYVANASILPQSGSNQSDSLSELFAPRSPGSIFVGLLKSRSVANDVIDRTHLLQTLHTSSYESARGALAGQSTFTIGADGIVTISVKDPSAQQAALLANAYIEGLQHLNETISQQQSREMQTFFQNQLEQERAALAKSESDLEAIQKKTGLIAPESQTQIGLNAIAGVRGQITALRVELAALLQSETDQNPQVQRLRSQIAQLEAQEATLESSSNTPLGAAPAAGQLPQNELDISRAQREVRYHDALVTSLSSQYGSAHLSEDLSRPAFQVIDRAVVPEHKSWPPRKLFLLLGIVLSFLCAVLVVTLGLVFRRITTDPANTESLRAIRQAFGSR